MTHPSRTNLIALFTQASRNERIRLAVRGKPGPGPVVISEENIVGLINDIVKRFSKVGQLVVDPVAGMCPIVDGSMNLSRQRDFAG